MPNTRPGITFDDGGKCSACNWHEDKKVIDWEERRSELHEIGEWARSTSHSPWDCVIGVSGGKDSTWQAMYVRDVMGLNPLLVQFAASEGNDLGRINLENLVELGFSVVSFQPAPLIAKTLARKSFLEHGNLCKYSETCLFPIPFRVAMAYGIPLVFFGENPALECGDANLGAGEPWDATTIRHSNTLDGAVLDIWLGNGVEKKDLLPYVFPPEEEFQHWGGRGIFMGYYLNWSGFRNGIYAIQNGLKTWNKTPEQIGCHVRHNCLDWEAIPINAMLKRVKLGFGHTTEFVCYDIRDGRVTREEGIALVKAFDGMLDQRLVEQHCEWIEMDTSLFWETVDKFYGDMWSRDQKGDWQMIDPIWELEPPSASISVDAVVERLNTDRIAAELKPLPIVPTEDEQLLV